jgi:hypothetical protein
MSRMRLRLLIDHSGEDVFLKTDRPPAELLLDAIRVMRRVNKSQSLFRLCLHMSRDVLTLHWSADDEKFAQAVVSVSQTVETEMASILQGAEPVQGGQQA